MSKKIKSDVVPNATLKEAVQGRSDHLETILGIDIAQLKHNLDLFKYSLDYAEAIVNTVREPLVILNKELRVLTANRAFYQTFRLLPKKLENKPFYELGTGELNIPKFRKLLQRVLNTGVSFEGFELEYNLPKVGKRIFLLNARKFYRQINSTQTILLAIEDVTKLRNIESQKDEFASIIMHELKGPVSTINGYVQLLQAHLSNRDDERSSSKNEHSSSTNKKLLKYTDNIEEQVHRLTSLINGLLNSSRIRAVGFEFKDTIFDLDELLKHTIQDIQKTSQGHRIVLEGQVQKYVKGDRDRIAQVLINLLTNAIKYSPNATDISVAVSLKQNKAIISVKDKGIGISSVNQKKVFDRFFKLSSSSQETFYGIGLGLDISSQIIRHHKGKIWLESAEGKGSEFNFSLPIHHT